MSYQKLFISRPSEGTKPWPKFLAQKSLKAKNNLKNLEKTKKKPYSRTLAKTKIQKTSRKPKKPKKSKKPIFQDSCKSKNAKIQKTSRKPKKTKKNKKTNVPGLLPVDPISRLLEYCFFFGSFGFFGFLEVFWIFAFLLLQESWNIVFFCFFLFFLVFSRFFGFLLLQESWNIVFYFGFLEVFCFFLT